MMQRLLSLLATLSWYGLSESVRHNEDDTIRRLQKDRRHSIDSLAEEVQANKRSLQRGRGKFLNTIPARTQAASTTPTTSTLPTTERATSGATTSQAASTAQDSTSPTLLQKQLETCTLCYNGTSSDAAKSDSMAWVGGEGYKTCAEAEQLVPSLAIGSLSCTDAQISGYAHCGCPALPPLYHDAECNFCSQPSYDIDLTKELPRFPRPSTLGPATCFDALILAHRSSNAECMDYKKAEYVCGCPGAAQPAPCSLCLSGSVPVPELEIVPGVTCQHVMDDLQMGRIEDCGAIQATAGVYCGCEANRDPRAKFDLPYAKDPCRICPDGETLPDTTTQLEDMYSVDGIDIQYFFSCGEAEWRINAFDICNDETTTSFASRCGCTENLAIVEVPDNELTTTDAPSANPTELSNQSPTEIPANEKPESIMHVTCTLCEDGSEPPMGDKLFPDVALGFAMTCQEVHSSFLESSSVPRGSEECRTYQDMGAAFCGCPTQPNQALCEYPCALNEIEDHFRFDYVQGETCASYWYGAKWAATTEACDYYTSRSNYCCEGSDLENACTFCYGGSEPTVEGIPTPNSLATCQSFFEDIPKLVSANDEKLCTYWQDWAYLNCGCPTVTPPLPDQVECDLFPEGCSIDDIDPNGEVLESILYAKLSRPTTETECLLAQQAVDLFICDEGRQANKPPTLTEGYTLTVFMEPDSLPYYVPSSAWVLLDTNNARVASSPVLRNGVTSTMSLVVPFDQIYRFVMMDAFGDGLDGGVYRITGAFPGEEPILLAESHFENGFFETTTIDTALEIPITTSATSQVPPMTTLPSPAMTISSTAAADIVDDGTKDKTPASVGEDESGVASKLGWLWFRGILSIAAFCGIAF